jgi:hypothetical protein
LKLYQTLRFNMVPPVGLEPTQYRYYWILSPTRLPVSSRMHVMARLTRFERATPTFGGLYSIQLSYKRMGL